MQRSVSELPYGEHGARQPALAIESHGMRAGGAPADHSTSSPADGRLQRLATATGLITGTASADGLLRDAQSWCAVTGQPTPEALGEGWLDAVHPDDRVCVATGWSAAVAHGDGFETTYRLRRRDGVYRDVLARAALPLAGEA
jgi:PAS domain-containing protein